MRVQFITPLVGFCWLICLKETHFSSAEINECFQVPPPCGQNAVCLDTARGFSCMCEPGYSSSKGDSWLPGSIAPLDCSDIDECSQNSSICGLHSFCINTPGSYSCRCQPGYFSPGGNSWKPGDSHSLNCAGINECSQVPPACGPNALCLDTARGFSCMCEPGYSSSKGDSWLPGSVAPLDCSDIDECSQVPSVCGLHSFCINTPGSYSCRCHLGYSSPGGNSWKPGDSHSLNCAGINECSQVPQPCGPNALCIDTAGGFSCMCAPGYRSSKGDSWLPGSVAPLDCSDIEECSQNPSICGLHSSCINTPGSYSCRCQPGYSSPGGNSWKPGDSHSLNRTGINECSQVPPACGPNALCLDTAGGFSCMCEPGYRSSKGDSWLPGSVAPLDCSDIDECSRDPSPCGPKSICSNTPGSYTCRCRAGYLPPSQPGTRFSCTEVTSKCRAHFSEENDLVRKSQNQSLDTAHGSSPEDAAYCTLLKSTFRALAEPCEEKNSAVCLEKAAEGFASILKQTSSWSNLSTEQLSILATIVLHSVERIVMDVLTNPTENGNLTLRTEQLDVQTKVISDGCSREDSVVSLGAKGEIMEIGCKTVQGSTAKGAAGVVFASYVGMETIMNGSFFQDQKAASSHAIRMISRVVSAWLTSQTKNFTDPVNYTFQHIMPHNPSEKPICVSWETTAQSGSWSPAGCRVLRSNATHTTCSCDHVSSLAVLMAWGE
ncbi:adhesion G protein-coupled receptor E1 isoform X3 [Pelodiscus sinensis]|uniref:adhesion G protein-coupled receptor E1 isoform X3 n=1 Tax=Pelodiscus sinensis TaxID=13735 RepID=UPI003F6CD6AD